MFEWLKLLQRVPGFRRRRAGVRSADPAANP
jgi:hypothetical protein